MEAKILYRENEFLSLRATLGRATGFNSLLTIGNRLTISPLSQCAADILN